MFPISFWADEECRVAVEADDFAKSLSETGRFLFERWRAGSSAADLPTQTDLNTAVLNPIMPYIFIVECRNGGYTFRMAGSEILRLEGDIVGKRLEQLIPPIPKFATVWRQYGDALNNRIFARHETLEWCEKEMVAYEVMLLPLRPMRDGGQLLIGTAHGAEIDQRRRGARADRAISFNFPQPRVSRQENGMMEIDYLSESIIVSPQTVRFSRQKMLEIGTGQPVPVLLRANHLQGMAGELYLELSAPQQHELVSRTAVFSDSPAGQEIFEQFSKRFRLPYPMRHFTDEGAARDWLNAEDATGNGA